jgi:hypothetical protein
VIALKKNKRDFLRIVCTESIKCTVCWESNNWLVWQDSSAFLEPENSLSYPQSHQCSSQVLDNPFLTFTPKLCVLNFMLPPYIPLFLPYWLFPWSRQHGILYQVLIPSMWYRVTSPSCSNWRDKLNCCRLRSRPSHVDVSQNAHKIHIFVAIRPHTVNIFGTRSLKIKNL